VIDDEALCCGCPDGSLFVSALRRIRHRVRAGRRRARGFDDSKSWGQIIDPSFYAFDANKRLDGNALFDLVKSAHGAGIKIVWHLDQIDVHIDCTTAWFAMTNHGSVGDSSGTQTMTWQESGLFNYVQGQWMLRFFHSNRVQPQS
jgi:hypothetical protein